MKAVPAIEERMVTGSTPFPTDYGAVFAEKPALAGILDLGAIDKVATFTDGPRVLLVLQGDGDPVQIELIYAVTIDLAQGALHAAKLAQGKGFPTHIKMAEIAPEEATFVGRLRVFAFLSDTEDHPKLAEIYLRTVLPEQEGEVLIKGTLTPSFGVDLMFRLRNAFREIKGREHVANMCLPKMQAEQQIAAGRAAAKAIEGGAKAP